MQIVWFAPHWDCISSMNLNMWWPALRRVRVFVYVCISISKYQYMMQYQLLFIDIDINCNAFCKLMQDYILFDIYFIELEVNTCIMCFCCYWNKNRSIRDCKTDYHNFRFITTYLSILQKPILQLLIESKIMIFISNHHEDFRIIYYQHILSINSSSPFAIKIMQRVKRILLCMIWFVIY